jgi:predicted Co/Zn/Cd cation transporter (cation efflux family)
MAVSYGIFASAVCWILAMKMHSGVKKSNSPLVKADAENWLVNAAISSSVLLAFAGIFLLRAVDLDHWAPYVDPIVVITLVAISIGVPVRMAWNAVMALLNKAPKPEIVEVVTQIVDASLNNLPVKERFVRVLQPGRQRLVQVHVVLPQDFEPGGLNGLDRIRARTYQALQKTQAETFVDILFTTERKWGAPISDGGFSQQTISST